MKKRVCIYLLLLAIMPSCNSKQPNRSSNVYIFNKSSCVEAKLIVPNLNIRSIPLSDSVIVRDNSSIAFDGSSYFIYLRGETAPVFRFDSNGGFVNQIGDIGNGPKEFTILYDLSLNKMNKTIEILSSESILKYAYDGNFLEKKIQTLPIFSFAIDDNQNYWFYLGNNRNDYKVVKTDKDFNLLEKYLEEKSTLLPASEQNFGKGYVLTFREGFSHTLHRIVESDLIESYKIDFGKYAFPSDLHTIPPMNVIELLRQKSHAVIHSYQENERYVFLCVLLNDAGSRIPEGYYWFIRKDDDKQLLMKMDANYQYLFNPQQLTDDDELLFLGIIPEADASYYDKNPSVIAVNINELMEIIR